MTLTAPVRPAPIEPTTPIRPSEAIRLGMLKYPVATVGHTILGDSACAVGAMLGGFGWDDRGDESSWADPRLQSVIPELSKGCPGDSSCHFNRYEATPFGVYRIAHLNDSHHWSRERIADWLEGLGL